MSYRLRYLKVGDIARIVADGDKQAGNSSTLRTISSQALDVFPITWAVTEARDSYLFHINARMREEWENTLFYFFCTGWTFRIRRLKGSSGEVSFQGFPRDQEMRRARVMADFIAAASVYGGYGHGPDGAFIGTLKALDHRFDASFVADNISPPGM